MRPRFRASKPKTSSNYEVHRAPAVEEQPVIYAEAPKRPAVSLLALLFLILSSCWSVYHYQFDTMPMPVSVSQAGKRGFSEEAAMEHVKALTKFGPHPVGSNALDLAVQYVLEVSNEIKKTAHWEVDVQVDFFHIRSGVNTLVSGLFSGKTLVYADLSHIVLRILPRYASDAGDNTILVSSHIDTVFSSDGAGDCSSCVAVMLELARAISHWAHGFKNGVIFLFNTGEEEGLNGAHSFITQHPWSSSISVAIDLEAMGIGGKSSIFQAGPIPWAVENYAMVAKHPSGQALSQDIFSSGLIKSATDFQVYSEVAGLSGIDFAYMDRTAVYHTKNDKLEFLKPGSFQHLGENMLAFLVHTGTSSELQKLRSITKDGRSGHDSAVYFDVLGKYMIVFRHRFATILYYSVIVQTLLIWCMSLLTGGYRAVVSLGLSVFTIFLMWTFSLSFCLVAAFILTLVLSSPVPYVANPWLITGIFGGPAILGALFGQHLGYCILQAYLLPIYSKLTPHCPLNNALLAKLDAERWVFKAGFFPWLILLIMGNYYKIGSTYLAVIWLVSPAFAYGLFEATLTPARSPKPLRLITLIIGLALPILVSSGIIIRLVAIMVGTAVRLDRNPGDLPEWLPNVVIAAVIGGISCLTLVFLLSYIHLSDAKRTIIFAASLLFCATLFAILSGIAPPFTQNIARAVNVVHVVDARRSYIETEPNSYILVFSITPGKLSKEIEVLDEGFVCSSDKVIDFVTFSAKYSCWTSNDSRSGWSESDIPTLHVERDVRGSDRTTKISINTKVSTRWSLAVNMVEIKDFIFEANFEELVPRGNKSSVDGWHIIQFSGGKDAPKEFYLTLFWWKNSTESAKMATKIRADEHTLLKLRTDVNKVTPKTERILRKFPPWFSMFGKSTSPLMFACLTDFPVKF